MMVRFRLRKRTELPKFEFQTLKHPTSLSKVIESEILYDGGDDARPVERANKVSSTDQDSAGSNLYLMMLQID